VVSSQILIFFLADPIPVIEHFGFCSVTPPKQSQRDASLSMYYCASSVSLDIGMLMGLGELPV